MLFSDLSSSRSSAGINIVVISSERQLQKLHSNAKVLIL